MTKSMIVLVAATLFLTGCATMQGTVDQACGSVVLSWLCGQQIDLTPDDKLYRIPGYGRVSFVKEQFSTLVAVTVDEKFF